MRNNIFAAVLLLSTVANANDLVVPIVRVIDGDTIETRLTLPSPLNVVSIRIASIDTPELPALSYRTTGKLGEAKCKQEAELALKAKQYVESLANTEKLMTVKQFSWDKYGGRIDGEIYIGAVNVGQQLINNNLAVPYSGTGPRKDWCQ